MSEQAEMHEYEGDFALALPDKLRAFSDRHGQAPRSVVMNRLSWQDAGGVHEIATPYGPMRVVVDPTMPPGHWFLLEGAAAH